MGAEGDLRAGFASACITPPVGVWLCGFANRDHAAEGVHDDLFARAMVFERDGTRLGIVSADLIGLDFPAVAEIRERAQRELGMLAGNVLLHGTHTHSGPALVLTEAMGPVDETYRRWLCVRIFTALSEACRDLRPAELSVGRGGPVGIGVNRRAVGFGPHELTGDPGGVHADHVDVLRVDRPDGSLGVLFSHATHPVTLGGDSYLFSADYVGYAVDTVQRVYGEDCFAMFVNGCCGNINSARVGTTFEDARRLGNMLAGAAVRVIEVAKPTAAGSAGGPLAGRTRMVELPVVEPPSLEEAERRAAELAQGLRAAESDGATTHELMQQRHMAGIAKALAEVVRRGPPWPTCAFDVTALRIGDVAMVGLSGEVFVEYQLGIDASSSFEHTMVFGTTNGVLGYLPTAAAYAEGGYEVDTAHAYYNEPLMIGPESEEIVRGAAAELLADLAEG